MKQKKQLLIGITRPAGVYRVYQQNLKDEIPLGNSHPVYLKLALMMEILLVSLQGQIYHKNESATFDIEAWAHTSQ